jgi:tetratricopeptide (TPR) repeat protein
LERFDYEHGMIYFGRTAAVNDVLTALRQQAAAGSPFVLVFGKSGVGKSSFIRAGVLPMLCDPGVIEGIRHWRRAIFEPSDSTGDSLDGLAAALFTPTALPELAGCTNEDELARLLRQSPDAAIPLIRTTLNEAAKAAGLGAEAGRAPPVRLALVIDPLEEVYSRPGASHEDRERFVAALSALASSGQVWVLGTMRSDFYERCGELPGLLALKSGAGQYHLAPPTSAEIGRMIRLPAQLAGLSFEEDEQEGPLDEVLKEAAASDPGALPLLQFALDEIYQRSRAAETGLLTFAAYRELGGIHGAIRTRAEEAIAQVGKLLGSRLEATYSAVFSLLVGVNQVTEHSVVRRYAYLDQINADADRKTLVEALIAARLFMTDIDDENRPVVTLAHEALLKHWPRLQHWIEENRDFLRIRSRVSSACARWREENREPAYLLIEGKPLAEAEHLLDRRGELSAEVIEYIEASAAAVRAEHIRARQRTRRILVTISSALVAALIFGMVSFWQFREARSQRNIAESNATDARQQRNSAVKRARASHELIEFLLADLRDSLAPDHERDAKLIEQIAGQVVAHYRKLDSERDAPQVKLEHANNLLGVAKIFRKMARFAAAAELAEVSLRLRESANEQLHIAADPNLPETLDLLGVCHNQLGDYSKADALFKRSVRENIEQFGEDAADTGRAYGRLAELYRQLGRYVESERLHRRAVAIAEAKLAPDDLELAVRYNDLAELLRYRERLEDSERLFNQALKIVSKPPIRDRRQLAEVQGNLGVLLADRNKLPEAEALLRATLEEDVKAVGAQNPLVAADRYKLSRVLIAQGMLEEADELLAESERILLRAFGKQHLRTAKCFEALAELRLAEKRADEAADYGARVLAIRNETLPKIHPEIIKAMELLVRVETARGRTDVAKAFATQAQEMHVAHAAQESAAEGGVAVGGM